jgi:hypothetical protein
MDTAFTGLLVLFILDPCGIEHLAGSLGIYLIVVFVAQVDYLRYLLLDERLGALVAGEERDIDGRAFKICGLELSMAFISAWQTKGYLVSSVSPSRFQGKISSEQPMGIPL